MKLLFRLLLLILISLNVLYAKTFPADKRQEVISDLLKAHNLYLRINNQEGLALSFPLLAKFYEQNGLWEEAEQNYREALHIQKKLKDKKPAANSAIHLAYILDREKNYVKALEYSEYAAGLYQKLGIKDSTASAYVQMANLNRKLGNYRRAENLILKKALQLYRSAGNVHGRIRCFRSLGHTYFEQKRYSEAKWFFIQENMQARELRDTSSVISSLLYLGKVKTDIRDFGLALKDFREAERLAENTGNISSLVYIQSAFARTYTKLGARKTARQRAEHSAALQDKVLLLQESEKKAALLLFQQAEKQLKQQEQLLNKQEKTKPLTVQEENSFINNYKVLFIVLALLALYLFIIFYFRKFKSSITRLLIKKL